MKTYLWTLRQQSESNMEVWTKLLEGMWSDIQRVTSNVCLLSTKDGNPSNFYLHTYLVTLSRIFITFFTLFRSERTIVIDNSFNIHSYLSVFETSWSPDTLLQKLSRHWWVKGSVVLVGVVTLYDICQPSQLGQFLIFTKSLELLLLSERWEIIKTDYKTLIQISSVQYVQLETNHYYRK